MNWLALPWVEYTLLLPLAGALAIALTRGGGAAARIAATVSVATFACSFLPWIALSSNSVDPSAVWFHWEGRPLFAVDGLSAPLLPLIAMLHALTVLSTAKVKANRLSFGGHLWSEAVRLAIFACLEPWPLIALLAFGTVPVLVEMIRAGKPVRLFLLHMALVTAALAAGRAGMERGEPWGAALLLAGALLRSGTVPGHLWVADLFEHATFGTALLFTSTLPGVYVVVRLVLPAAPDWALQGLGIASLVTAVYAACMAVVQTDARRFFAYVFLSHAASVLVGLELHTTISLTGALCLWVSVALSLTGLGLTLRALEARYGRLSLREYRGLYDQSPSLAIAFLLTGLGSVGFPGTLGFVAADLLIDGAVGANLPVGIALLAASAMNGIAVVRAYLFLFTGTRHHATMHLGITPRERFAILALAATILLGGLIPQPGVADRYRAAVAILEARARVVPSDPATPTH